MNRDISFWEHLYFWPLLCYFLFWWVILLAHIIIDTQYNIYYPQEIEARRSVLIEKFQTIEHPQGAQQVRFEVRGRPTTEYIQASYTYDMNSRQAVDYYLENLIFDDWIVVSVSKERYRDVKKILLEKGLYEIELLIDPDGNDMPSNECTIRFYYKYVLGKWNFKVRF